MRNILLIAVLTALLAALVAAPAAALDRLHVVTTIPDLADIAEELGGDRVDVRSLARGTENIHRVTIRPSHLVAVGRAELFFEIGMSLEHAFVPGLLEAARNRALRPGEPGFVNVSQGFPPLNVPDAISRGLSADVHPDGNPHLNLSPNAGRHMARRILDGLIAVDPEGAETFRVNHAAYLERLAEAEERWAEAARRLSSTKVVAYHGEFLYLADAAGIEIVGLLEPRPGVPPTPGHLAELLQRIEATGAQAILTAKWSNNSSVEFIAERSGLPVLELPTMVGGSSTADTWIGLLDELYGELVETIGHAPDPLPEPGPQPQPQPEPEPAGGAALPPSDAPVPVNR